MDTTAFASTGTSCSALMSLSTTGLKEASGPAFEAPEMAAIHPRLEKSPAPSKVKEKYINLLENTRLSPSLLDDNPPHPRCIPVRQLQSQVSSEAA